MTLPRRIMLTVASEWPQEKQTLSPLSFSAWQNGQIILGRAARARPVGVRIHAGPLNLQSDRAHERHRVAPSHRPRLQPVVEGDPVALQVVLEMDVGGARRQVV